MRAFNFRTGDVRRSALTFKLWSVVTRKRATVLCEAGLHSKTNLLIGPHKGRTGRLIRHFGTPCASPIYNAIFTAIYIHYKILPRMPNNTLIYIHVKRTLLSNLPMGNKKNLVKKTFLS